jgi:hypothetical protein
MKNTTTKYSKASYPESQEIDEFSPIKYQYTSSAYGLGTLYTVFYTPKGWYIKYSFLNTPTIIGPYTKNQACEIANQKAKE